VSSASIGAKEPPGGDVSGRIPELDGLRGLFFFNRMETAVADRV